ncbi:GNAT family N-acetyltransferase [Candidatus Bathyarchaeota archaeon]|nr:MAG: GNAT family N-acetyltransferase [Candidatus Bathyarchaeota archaeon]
MTITIRNFTDKDLSNIVKLLNETRRESYEPIPFSKEELSSQIKEWNLEILVAEEEGEIVGSAAYNNGQWGEEIEWLSANEKPNRKFIENLLVTEIEKHVKGDTVFTVVDAESPEINEWTKLGFMAEGGLYHMVARLDGLRSLPEVPEGIVIRYLREEEEKDFVEAVNAGFNRERLEQGVIQKWKSKCPPFSEEWIHVAELNENIVSVIVSRPDVKYNRFFRGNRGYLGPAATLPEYRRKNLASALTFRAMNSLFKKKMNSVALYTSEKNTASVNLLRKLGFKIGHHWRFMRKARLK